MANCTARPRATRGDNGQGSTSAGCAACESRVHLSLIEAFNVLEADEMDCHIITALADILEKLSAFGTKKAAELALDGVKTFRADAVAAGLSLQLASCADAAE